MNTYRDWHKAHPFEIPRIEKSKMSSEEIGRARSLIALLNKKRKTATQIIKALQKRFRKLSSEADAARVFWTETKRADTKATTEIGKEIGLSKYRVILSPSACKVCRKKTDNGDKVFKTADLEKSGYGHAPPFHPNCYCIVVPLE